MAAFQYLLLSSYGKGHWVLAQLLMEGVFVCRQNNEAATSLFRQLPLPPSSSTGPNPTSPAPLNSAQRPTYLYKVPFHIMSLSCALIGDK